MTSILVRMGSDSGKRRLERTKSGRARVGEETIDHSQEIRSWNWISS
jgi:hypothetical protein